MPSSRLLPVVALLLAFPCAAAEPSPVEAKAFEILEANCFGCHSAEVGKPKGGLDLSTKADILKGGASGDAVVPGKSKESLLLQLLAKDGGTPHMPPKDQLYDADIAAVAKWIDSLPAGKVAEKKLAGADHWAFQKVKPAAVPEVKQKEWVRNPIDAFILAKLESKGLSPSAAADKPKWLRRVTFDLTGLPPTPEELKAFLTDESSEAYAKVADRLLASPAYGERWGRHWLDLARYADTGGFHNDLPRPNAWRYRDYVVQSFNDDKPFADFVREQLAGDEFAPENEAALIATGFGRNGPSNDDNMGKTPKDLEKYRLDELDGVLSTTFTTFLGLTLGCARCHDHKYDPILQKDYYRVLAIFNGTAKKEIPLAGEELEKGKLKNPDRGIMALVDATAKPKPTHLLWRGDANNPGPQVEPGVPAVFATTEAKFTEPSKDAKGSGRRKVLADWIASPENPLTYRVLANRLWQHHFGRGLVLTSGNFGRSGSPPSHPELLDYLANKIVSDGGKLKPLHKAIVLSSTYRQSSNHEVKAAAVDPENALLWRQNKRRLEAEAVRDGILAVAGTLNSKMGGPGVKPRIRADLLPTSQRNKWPVIAEESPEQWRRSVYIYTKRQLLFPLMELFDAPTTTDVCDRRTASVVPTQALLLMNDEFVADQAKRFATKMRKEHGPDAKAVVETMYGRAIGRAPTAERVRDALAFLESQTAVHRSAGKKDPEGEAWIDFAHVLLNCNEFIFVD